MIPSRVGLPALALLLLAVGPAPAQPAGGQPAGVSTPDSDVAGRDPLARRSRMVTDWRRFGEVRVVIDPDIDDERLVLSDERRGQRRTSVATDARNRSVRFISDELIVAPRSDDEMRRFLGRTGGTVLDHDGLPALPADARGASTSVRAEPRLYIVRIDHTRIQPGSLQENASSAGFGGTIRVSDGVGERLLSLLLSERRNGMKVWTNEVGSYDYGVNVSNEGAAGDAFTSTNFQVYRSSLDPSPRYSNIRRAWRLMDAANLRQQVPIAIIDGGFWLVNRVPGDAASIADFGQPLQFNVLANNFDAGGNNPLRCTGGAVCPWHGHGVAGVALARANNNQGTAGTGGFIAARPIFIRSRMEKGELLRAIPNAVAMGARVINISGGYEEGWWDDIWPFSAQSPPMYDAIIEAEAAGVVVVASAGNGGKQIDEERQPCAYATICVGALLNDSNLPSATTNFGPRVTIFAPQPVWSWNVSGATPVPGTFGGTSASAPFIAGVVAMMRSANPALSPYEIRQAMIDSAWTQPLSDGGGRVDRWVNAYGAVHRAINGRIADDSLEFGDNPDFPRPFQVIVDTTTTQREMTLRDAKDIDSFGFAVTDYTRVTIRLDYFQDLNSFGMRLESNSKHAPFHVNETVATDTRSWVGSLSPGRYTLVVTGGGPNRYDLSIAAVPATLPPDRFDRGPFRNNAFIAAAAIQSGTYDLTLHNVADRDWFSISVPPGMGVPIVSVNAEFPVTLQLVDPATRAVIGQRTDVTVGGLSLETGRDYRVFVDSARPTRYVLAFSDVRKLLQPPAAYLTRDWFKPFNPGDPPPFIHGPWDIWPIQPGPDIRRLVAETPDIKLSLFRSGAGHPVRVSQPDAAGSQVLDLSKLPRDAQYAVIAEYKAGRTAAWYPHEFTRTHLTVERGR